MSASGIRLLYGFDPLCGWCFGFIPAMRALREAEPSLPIDLWCGGLVTHERAGPYAAMAPYIRGASERMEAVTGQKVSERFFTLISDPNVRSSSAPPTYALLQVRKRAPEHLIEFAHRLQEAHFEEGRDQNAPETHCSIAESLGFALELNTPLAQVDDTHPEVAAEFARARSAGISSFPTVLLHCEERDEPRRLSTSYDPSEFVATVRAALG